MEGVRHRGCAACSRAQLLTPIPHRKRLRSIRGHNAVPHVHSLCACRLTTWLDELGPKSADVLKSCMDLLAKGIVVPTAGTHVYLFKQAARNKHHNPE